MSTKYLTKDNAIRLIKEMEMPENIKKHSFLVRDVCEKIFESLRNKETVNWDLVEVSALLHDITKAESLKTGENHAETGSALLNKMGFPDVAEIILNHIFLKPVDIEKPLTESEIVHYADKRVKHCTVVTLNERMTDLVERYGKTEHSRSEIMGRMPFLTRLEEKIRLNLINDIEPDLMRFNEK